MSFLLYLYLNTAKGVVLENSEVPQVPDEIPSVPNEYPVNPEPIEPGYPGSPEPEPIDTPEPNGE